MFGSVCLSAVSLGARTSLGVHGICTLRAQILYLSKGPQEIQLGKAGSSLVKKEPKQQVNHAVVRACLASLACLYTQALQAGFPGSPGYPGRLTHWQQSQATQAVHR